MTTIPLQTALERATKGPLLLEPEHPAEPLYAYLVPENGANTENCIVRVVGVNGEEVRANAAILAHCRNTLPALVEALQRIENLVFRLEERSLTRDMIKAEISEALRAAQNVQMP